MKTDLNLELSGQTVEYQDTDALPVCSDRDTRLMPRQSVQDSTQEVFVILYYSILHDLRTVPSTISNPHLPRQNRAFHFFQFKTDMSLLSIRIRSRF